MARFRLRPPALPIATREYQQGNAEALHSVLRLFFTSAVNAIESLASITNADDFSVSTASNYTTTGAERLIVATGAITITLNADPEDFETVTIKRATTAGAVTISGNGNTIDGSATFSMISNYDSYTVVYSVDAAEWLIT